VGAAQLSGPAVVTRTGDTAGEQEDRRRDYSRQAKAPTGDQRLAGQRRRLLELSLEKEDGAKAGPRVSQHPDGADLLGRRDRLLKVTTGSLDVSGLGLKAPEIIEPDGDVNGVSCLAEAGERLQFKPPPPVR
jgi:hypothetical protein